jgi:hypothetical protein
MSQTRVPTTNFCDYYNIEWFPINVSINGTEKVLNEIMHDLYKSIKCDECKSYKSHCKCAKPNFYKTYKPDIHNFTDRLKERQALFIKAPELFTHLTISTKNIFHIDIDNEDYEDAFDNIAYSSPWFPSMTKSYGKHILCKFDGFVPSSSRMQFLNWGKPNEVELLCGIGSYAPFFIENADQPFYDLKVNFFKVKLDIPTVSKPKPQMSKALVKTVGQFDKIMQLSEIIDDKFICSKGCYDDWRNILWGLRSESGEYKDLAKTMSNRPGANYDEAVFDATWDSYKDGKISIGTFYHYAKKSDLEKYNEIMNSGSDTRHCSNDLEAACFVYDDLKDYLKSVDKRIFYYKDNIWISDENHVRDEVSHYIMNSNIHTMKNDKTGVYFPYVQNISKMRNVLDTLILKVNVENDDSKLYDKFHKSTRGKICFNDGVLDFKLRTFSLWSDVRPEDVCSTMKIDKNFKDYFENPDRAVINEIKECVLKPLFGDKMDLALHFLSRALAGHHEDKRWATYLGNRNCGKGLLYEILQAAFQGYVSTFELGNIIYSHKSAGMDNLDCSKKLYWLMDLEFVRLAVSQEVPESKAGLYVNSKIMKKITGGGDEIVARRNYDRRDTHFRIDTSFMIMGNYSLLMDSEDCDENRVEFESVVQFKSKAEIDKLGESCDSDEMERYKLADPIIKDKCRTDEWSNAMIYLIFESYQDKPIDIIKEIDDEQVGMVATLKTLFEFTKDDTPILASEVSSLMKGFDKKKLEIELSSRNIFKKKHIKRDDLRMKWCYYGLRKLSTKKADDNDLF